MKRLCLGLLLTAAVVFAANPITTELYTADAAAMVYNDSLFIFTGHDEQGPAGNNNKAFVMNDWHVFVTDDMVNYHDYGAVLSVGTFKWANASAFAGHCEFHNGKFYWYVAVHHASIKQDEGFAIGVAVADHPSGPWVDAIGAPLITDLTENDVALNIDPAIFFDGDDIWMYWGSWNACRRVKLKDSMIELAGKPEVVNEKAFFEAPWIHKFRGQYYFSYASGYPSTTNYSVSNSAAGPWTAKGVINTKLDNSETNHQAIVRYLGHWYFIYHGANSDGGWTYRRSVNVDYLYYDENANIVQIKRTSTGPDKVNNAPVMAGIYTLTASHSNLALTDEDGVVVQRKADGGDAQLWTLVPSEKNRRYYSLTNVATGKNLCIAGLNLLDTVRTAVTPCELRIENASEAKGYYLYADFDSDFVGDILNISKNEGMPLIAWTRSGTDNQKIQLKRVSDIVDSSSSADTLTLHSVAGAKNASPILLRFSREGGVQFNKETNYLLADVQGNVLRMGRGARFDVASLNAGVYVLRCGHKVYQMRLR